MYSHRHSVDGWRERGETECFWRPKNEYPKRQREGDRERAVQSERSVSIIVHVADRGLV